MNKFEQLIRDLDSAAGTCEIEDQDPEAEAVYRAIEILERLNQWCDAYPEDIFIPMSAEDWKEHHEILRKAKRSGSAAAADSMRHVVNGFKRELHQ